MKSNTDYSSRLHRVIPGGAHTYSRGDDQYPSNAPPILSRGKGCFVWDAEGNKFLDYGMALRAVTVGYAYEPIAEAAIAEIRKGNNLTRASLTELQAAELITETIPCAEMVKFAKNGSTVTTAALKLARAYTGRKYIAICAEHPFFSYDDWFIGSTAIKRGIPAEHAALTLRFHYNDISSLEDLFEAHNADIAAVIMEPATTTAPCTTPCPALSDESFICCKCSRNEESFLQQVRKLCTRYGAVLIFDEMITGFRWHLKGAQYYFGIEPDLATFGKGMANGFSVAALTGKREIMELGGIQKAGQERTFLISTTHGAEMSSLGAFIKTFETYRTLDVIHHLWLYGLRLMNSMNAIADELGIGPFFQLEGYPCSPVFVTKDMTGTPSLPLRTLFLQEMVDRGVLMPWIALSFQHGEQELEMTLQAARGALAVYAEALNKGAESYLRGETIKPVFRKYN